MIFLLGQFNKNSESWDVRWNLQFSFIFAVVMLLMLYTLIPIILKVGVEKGRIAQFGIVGIIFLVGYMGSNIIEKMDLLMSKTKQYKCMHVGEQMYIRLPLTITHLHKF